MVLTQLTVQLIQVYRKKIPKNRLSLAEDYQKALQSYGLAEKKVNIQLAPNITQEFTHDDISDSITPMKAVDLDDLSATDNTYTTTMDASIEVPSVKQIEQQELAQSIKILGSRKSQYTEDLNDDFTNSDEFEDETLSLSKMEVTKDKNDTEIDISDRVTDDYGNKSEEISNTEIKAEEVVNIENSGCESSSIESSNEEITNVENVTGVEREIEVVNNSLKEEEYKHIEIVKELKINNKPIEIIQEIKINNKNEKLNTVQIDNYKNDVKQNKKDVETHKLEVQRDNVDVESQKPTKEINEVPTINRGTNEKPVSQNSNPNITNSSFIPPAPSFNFQGQNQQQNEQPPFQYINNAQPQFQQQNPFPWMYPYPYPLPLPYPQQPAAKDHENMCSLDRKMIRKVVEEVVSEYMMKNREDVRSIAVEEVGKIRIESLPKVDDSDVRPTVSLQYLDKLSKQISFLNQLVHI